MTKGESAVIVPRSLNRADAIVTLTPIRQRMLNWGYLGMCDMCEVMEELASMKTALTEVLALLKSQRVVKDWYSIDEVATALGKAPYTIREHARAGRIVASKRLSGRGKHKEWCVSHAELCRIRNEGLLPLHTPTP